MKLFSFLLLVISVNSFAQSTEVYSSIVDQLEKKEGAGEIKIFQESQIVFMLETNIENNRKQNGVEGYRIQLYSGSSRQSKDEAFNVKSKLLSQFPQENVYVEYNAPFWRVRVGDYRTKSESLLLLKKLKKYFPNCYPVKDNHVSMSRLAWCNESTE